MQMRVSGITAAVVLAVTLAACGGDPAAEPAAEPATSTAPVAPSTKVSLSVETAPVAQSPSGQDGHTAFHGRVRPAVEGAEVQLERRRASGGWEPVAQAVQDRSGAFQGSYVAKRREALRARVTPDGAKKVIASPVQRPTGMRLVFEDDFSGDALDPAKWYVRHQPMHGSRMCSQPATDRVSVAEGVATLTVRKFDDRATKTCPYGRFHNAMIGTTGPYRFQEGVFAARVKFQEAKGMHGAFWLQGYPITGAEIDIAEYFGEGTPEELTILIHHTDANGELHTAGKRDDELPTRRILGKGATPADDYHVYSVDWDADRYRFFLDGQLMMTTTKPMVASSPEEMVLSLLTSDWELNRMKSTTSSMKVDWVRAWQKG